jgi:hypothetical protein
MFPVGTAQTLRLVTAPELLLAAFAKRSRCHNNPEVSNACSDQAKSAMQPKPWANPARHTSSSNPTQLLPPNSPNNRTWEGLHVASIVARMPGGMSRCREACAALRTWVVQHSSRERNNGAFVLRQTGLQPDSHKAKASYCHQLL